MNVTADCGRRIRLWPPSVYDDEGVAAQSWDLASDGKCSSVTSSTGRSPHVGSHVPTLSYADLATSRAPIQRMANISLQPGIEDPSTRT